MIFALIGLIVVVFVVITMFQVFRTISRTRTVLRNISEAAAALPETDPARSFGATGDPSDAGILAALPGQFDPTAAGELEAVIQFRLTDRFSASWHLDISGGTCRLVRGEADAPRTTVLAPSGVIADVVEGRLSADAAFMAGKVQVEGDNSLLFRFNQLFPPGRSNASPSAMVGQSSPPAPSLTSKSTDDGRKRFVVRTKISETSMTAVVGLIEGLIGPALEGAGQLSKSDAERVIAAALTGRFEDESILLPGATGTSFFLHGDGQHHHRLVTRREGLQTAVGDAMRALPSDAGLPDKARALRAALQRLTGQPVDVELPTSNV